MVRMKSIRWILSELPMFTTRQGATGLRLSPSTASPRAVGRAGDAWLIGLKADQTVVGGEVTN